LLVGAVGKLTLQVVLVTGAYMMRITPEVVNCDRGRQSVHVEVTKALRAYQTHLVHREIGECSLWFHAR
jgi:hypothetical protein